MKIKKIICLVLILALTLPLYACGGGSSKSKEELLAVAKDYTSWTEFKKAVNNKPEAESLVGETCFIQGYVYKIESNYCVVFPTESGSGYVYLHVYLSKDELEDLKVNDQIFAVGIIDADKTEDYMFMGSTIERVYFEIKNTCLIDPYENVNLQEMIDIFGGHGGDGHYDWTEGSYPYFMHYREDYELLKDSKLINTLTKSTWTAKYYADEKANITIAFHDDGTLTFMQDGDSEKWNWELNNEYLSFSRRIWEVRQINDNTLVFYEVGTPQPPNWILVKDDSTNIEAV